MRPCDLIIGFLDKWTDLPAIKKGISYKQGTAFRAQKF